MQQNYYLTNGTRSGQSHSRSGTIDENLALRPNKFIIKTQQNSGQQNTGQAPVTIHKKMSQNIINNVIKNGGQANAYIQNIDLKQNDEGYFNS